MLHRARQGAGRINSVVAALQRFPVILDHPVIQYDREAPSILVLAHVLVGEPDPPSGQARGHASPGQALIELVEMMDRAMAVADIEPVCRSDGGGDVSFCGAHRGFEITAFGQARGDGG
jgi:hypothetical protein